MAEEVEGGGRGQTERRGIEEGGQEGRRRGRERSGVYKKSENLHVTTRQRILFGFEELFLDV